MDQKTYKDSQRAALEAAYKSARVKEHGKLVAARHWHNQKKFTHSQEG